MKRVGQIFRETLIDKIKGDLQERDNTFLLTYSGVSSLSMNNFRKDLKRKNADLFVSRKSLTKLALEGDQFSKILESLDGQTAFVWSDEDSVEISKLLVKFAKECDGVAVRGGVLQGEVLVADDVVRLSSLPSKDVLRAQLLATIQSPLTRLASALNAKTRDLLSILKQLSEKKGGN